MDSTHKMKITFKPREILLLIIFCILVTAFICGVFTLKITGVYGSAMFAGKNFRNSKAEAFAAISNNTPKGSVVFFGDSITEMYDLESYYPNKEYVNRGIGGDLTTDLIARADSNVIKIEPKVIVLLIGTNDLNTRSVEDTTQSYYELLEILTTDLPDTTVIVQSVLPVCILPFAFSTIMVSDRNNDKIQKLNGEIESLCNTFDLIYADTAGALMKNGSLNPNYALDGLHINAKGYSALTGVLNTYLDIYST